MEYRHWRASVAACAGIRSTLRLGWGVAALGAAVAAHAQMYICTTGSGQMFTGDYIPTACRNHEIRVLNPDGSVREIIPAPLTSEQRKAQEAADEARRKKEQARLQQERRDRALFATYSSVGDIEAARRQTLTGLRATIQRADAAIAQYQRERKRLDEDAEFYLHHPMPARLTEEFQDNRILLRQQRQVRDQAQAEVQRVNQQFDADRQRYIELQGGGAADPAGAARPY